MAILYRFDRFEVDPANRTLLRKQRSTRSLMHLVVPVIGFAIIAYVIVNADSRAQVTAATWLIPGAVIHFVRRTP